MQDLYSDTESVYRMFCHPEAYREKTVDDVIDLWSRIFKPRAIVDRDVIVVQYEPRNTDDIPKVGIGFFRRGSEGGYPVFRIFPHTEAEVHSERSLEWASGDGSSILHPDYAFSG